ncbi:hypothetical protein [Kibdelosporangium aridum]|uniref:Uncharacterized protein n=1 Tax=Kibdelosporangium aridum TaxID=2030 RepID=A0A1W2CFX8_KIBAR|nr:hypothetical protein [Kibdelosporangium aridum]SMC83874.1 hypothetical protein SAMN05661093_01967 [Kibdelosporangium aridum]
MARRIEQQPDDQARATPALPPTSVAGLQGAGNAAMSRFLSVQRDVVSDVEERMSYSVTDWAVTDEEATESLNDLAGLPAPALAAALGRLSQTAKTRLLDNLPANVRQTSAFTKVLVAMGPDAVQPYVDSLLSYGVFDWAITDDDATGVFRILVALQPAQQATLAQKLGGTSRARLADNLVRSSTIGDAEHGALRVLFDATPDSEVETMKLWMKLRFRIEFGTQTSGSEVAEEWDGASLRRMYNVLQSLPPGAVEGNPELLRIDRYRDTGPAGGYYGSDRRIAMGYGDLRARDGVVDPVANPGGSGMSVVPAPLQGQNLFDGVVRHEVGHAVDNRLGLSQTYCIGNAAGGNWQAHGDGGSLAATLVSASGGTINGLPPEQKTAVVDALQEVITDRVPEEIQTRLEALSFWASLDAATKTAILGDNAVRALQICFADKNPGNPWYRPADDGGVTLGGRVYQEAYASQWWSYDPATRARKVSSYQFRAPGEWIAEAYNAYYAPPTKGAILAAADPATKAWFDVNVDQATGGEGAAGPGPLLPDGSTGPGFP